jgi:hypothetical protein
MTMEEERDSRRGLTTKIGRKGGKETVRLPGTGVSYSKKPIKFGTAKSSTPTNVVSALLLISVILWLMASMH